MSTLPSLNIERIDDLPLLFAQMERMGLCELLDRHFPRHGNWRGQSLGWVTTIWLAHILSESDHRLNQLEPWALSRLETLCACTGQKVRREDLTDDRLALVLKALAHEERFAALEAALTGLLLRVYELPTECLRVDMTTASSERLVTPEGLFQWGHSKDRPDQPQLKIALATLDPLGLPLATAVVAGNHTDDPLYVPAIARVRGMLAGGGRLYVGDCKMAALETRLAVQQGGDYYLCPLPEKQLTAEEWDAYLTPVREGRQPLTVLIAAATPEEEPLSEGYTVNKRMAVMVANRMVVWTERRLVVRDPVRAKNEAASLLGRVDRAKAALFSLNERGRGKRRGRELQKRWAQIQAIVQRHQVGGLLQVSCAEQVTERSIRRWRERPARVVVERDLVVTVTVDQAALAAVIDRLGWRVYATNAPEERLQEAAIVPAYRGQYVIERGFGRLKGRPLSLVPMYLQKEEHVVGLIRLLTLALRVLCLVEFAVRRSLHAAGASLVGLYAGQPKRTTERPTTEALLRAFSGIHLVLIGDAPESERQVTPLNPLQQRILTLMGLPSDTYTRLSLDFLHPYPE